MKTKLYSIDQIKPNPDNPRVIRDEKFKKLVQSIREFPGMLEIRPIVCNPDLVVLGGNMRLQACREAGVKKIPVLIADLTPEQQREFIVKDNLGYGEWDWDKLANEWDEELLVEWGMDIPEPEKEPQDQLYLIEAEFITEEEREEVMEKLEKMGLHLKKKERKAKR